MDKDDKTKVIDLMDYWRMIVRRRWIAITFAGAVILFTAIYSFVATPLYKSKVTLLIEDQSSKMLSIDQAFAADTRIVQDMRNFNTQLKLLKSKSLALRVARKLNLVNQPNAPAAERPKANLLSGLKYVLTLKWLTSGRSQQTPPASGGTLNPPDPYSGLADLLLARTAVTPVRDTKLVELTFISRSPEMGAEIANTLAEEFINFSVEQRYSSTRLASDFYTEQINRLQEDLGSRERELQRYGSEKDIGFLSDAESATVNTFASLSQAYDQAILARINAEAEYREISNLEGESLPQLITDPAVQQLKAEYTTLRTEYDEKSKTLKAEHPDMIRIQARLDSLRQEITKAAGAAEARVKAAQQKEYSIKAQLDRQKNDVTKMKNNAILYNSIKSEVESKRRLLNTLVERQSETQISAQISGLNASNISIVDRAEVPRVPFSPNRANNLLMALLIGLFGGVGLSFLFDYLDDTIKGPEEVENLVSLPSLGVVPFLPPEGLKKGRTYSSYLKRETSYGSEEAEKEHTLPEVKEVELINHLYPRFSISEDYRTLRTSILFSLAGRPPKSIVFTSAMTQEGKTATVVNLAVSFAQLQERVLVVETDLRKPRLHRLFKIRNVGGLTGYLTGKVPLKEVVQKTFIDNIWIIPSGPIPPNPVELLNSGKMKDMLAEVREVFDVILLDSPPVLAVIDPVIISSIVDSTVLVLHGGKTRRKPFLAAVEELRKAKANILGVVFNAADIAKEGGYYSKYYRYHKYGHYGEEQEGSPPKPA
jgi:succinoglycan biosynthesis transport protein ExoP